MRSPVLRALALVLVAVAAASCATQQGTSAMDVAMAKSSADSLWTRYAAAADQHDRIAFGALFTEDGTLSFSGAPAVEEGRPAIEQFLDSLYAKVDMTGFRVRPYEFHVSATLAAEAGSFEEDATVDGKETTRYGRFAMWMEHGQDGAWRMRHLTAVVDSIRPPAGGGRP